MDARSLALALVGVAAVVAVQDTDPAAPPQGGLVTLYALDDIQCSFDFRTGAAGARIRGGEVVLDEAQIVFAALQQGALSFGFARDERVNVIDLGPLFVAPQPRARDRSPSYSISVFQTLFMKGANFAYIGPGERSVPLPEAKRILDLLPAQGLYHLEPQVGHIYLLRAKLRGVGGSEEIVKFMIVDHQPGSSLTLRWARLTS